MKVVLTAAQANSIIKYLATKPYQEVAQLIEIIQSCVVEEKENDEQ